MPQQTADPEATARQATPPDIETMREVVNRLLDPDATPEALPPAAEELDTLTLQIRGHLDLLMPEVEQAALRLSKESIPRYCALACLGEARGKLAQQLLGAETYGALVYARRLARALNAMCDHHQELTGGGTHA